MANREVKVAIIGDASSLNRALRSSETGLAGFSQRMQRVGDRMTTAGRRMTTGITLPIVAVGALATKAAIDFETAFAGVRKTVEATEPQFAALEQGIRDMAQEIPATAVEIAAVAEAAGQLGVAQGDILGFTRVMIDLGETTNLSATDAATALARFGNITGLAGDQFDELGSVIVELGNNMATTESEITEFGVRLAGAGTGLGLTEDAILAIAAAMSSVGVQAEAGGTAMSRVFNAMGQAAAGNQTKLDAFAGVAGTTADEFKRMIDSNPEEAVLAFVDGFGQLNAQEQADALSEIGVSGERVLSALQRLAGPEGAEGLAEALGMASDAWADNNALTEEAAQRYGTTAARLDIAKNKINDLMIILGERLIPILERVVDKVVGFADAMGRLDTPTQNLIIAFAGIAAAAGPVLWIMEPLVSAIGFFTTTVGLVALALVAVGVAFGIAYTKSDTFRGMVDGMVDALAEVGDAMGEVIGALSGLNEELGGGKIEGATVAVWALGAAIAVLVAPIAAVMTVLRPFIAAATAGFGNIARTVDLVKAAVNALRPVFDQLRDAVMRVIQVSWGPIRSAISGVSSALSAIVGVVNRVISAIRTLGSMTLGGLAGAIGGIAGALGGAVSAANSLVSALGRASAAKASIGVIPKSFTGGISAGGPTLVGESGPELAYLPQGTKVRTASRTAQLLSSDGNQAPSVSPDDLRRALSGMRFEMGDGFITMVSKGLRDQNRQVA